MSSKGGREKEKVYRFALPVIEKLREQAESLGDDEKREWVEETHSSEIYDALNLIRAGIIEPNIFSSPDWLQEIQERLRSVENTPTIIHEMADVLDVLGFEYSYPKPQPESNYDLYRSFTEMAEGLKYSWNKIDGHSTDDCNSRESENSIPNNRFLTIVHAFVGAILRGEYPTPEIMLSLAMSLDLYLTAVGELTLEEVFFGKPKKGAGIFASRTLRDLRFQVFHDCVIRERALSSISSNSKFSINEMADRFLLYDNMDDDGEVDYYDIDSFLRGYRRWKSKMEIENDG